MSYLLDALRKSEQERRIGQVPTLEPEPIAQEPPRRSHWLIGIVASLVIINSGMLLYVFLPAPDNSQHKGTPAVENASVSTANETAKSTRHAETPEPSPTVKPSAPTERPGTAAPRSIADMIAAKEREKTAAAQQLVRKARKPTPPTTKKPVPIARAAMPQTKDSMTVPAKKKSATPAATAKKKTEENKRPAVEVAALRSSPPPTAAARPPAGSVPLLRKLPSGFRRKVPTMTINVFVYSERVKERFVIINMAKYRTGDKIENGPVLEAIRPDSLVLRFEGRRFRVERP
jgi:general secretion pathway protein B